MISVEVLAVPITINGKEFLTGAIIDLADDLANQLIKNGVVAEVYSAPQEKRSKK